jgi:hypothetical protein
VVHLSDGAETIRAESSDHGVGCLTAPLASDWGVRCGATGLLRWSSASCARVGTTVVTIIAGPLNYVGANPKIDCEVPQPSR